MRRMWCISGDLSAGKRDACLFFQGEQRPDGALWLRLMARLTSTEAWAHEPAMLEPLRRADEWAKRTSPATTDLDSLARKASKRKNMHG